MEVLPRRETSICRAAIFWDTEATHINSRGATITVRATSRLDLAEEAVITKRTMRE